MRDTGYKDIHGNTIYEHSCIYQILDNSKEELRKYGHNLFGFAHYDPNQDNDGWMMRVLQNDKVTDWAMPQRCVVLDDNTKLEDLK